MYTDVGAGSALILALTHPPPAARGPLEKEGLIRSTVAAAPGRILLPV